MMKPHLLAVFGPLPDIDHPSGRIYWRHLQRFVAEGWRVTVTAEGDCGDSPIPGVTIIHLPTRRAGWPPVRNRLRFTVAWRHVLLGRLVAPALCACPPDLVLAGGGHVHLDLARRLAGRFICPLHVVLHDWWPDFCVGSVSVGLAHHIQRKVFPSAECIWAVSPALAGRAREQGAPVTRVLRPIPEGAARKSLEPEPQAPSPPLLAAIGSYGAGHAPVYAALARRLRERGGRLTVVCRQIREAKEHLGRHANIEVRPYFSSPQEALRFASQCTAIVVAQPLPPEQHPWTLTSFPSKLVEYVHAHRPILILADPASAVGAWAQERRWQPYAGDLADTTLDAALEQLSSPAGWQIAAALSGQAAADEFSPDRIHALLRDGLLASLGNRNTA